VITQIANGIEQIKLGSLHPTRDFNYIDDTVKGFIAACEADSAIGEVINIGSAFEVSIGETVKYIADIMDSHVDIVSDEQRIRPTASEVERLFADNNKARQLLNWSPQYAGVDGFKQGLNKTIDWFTNNDNIKHYKSHIYNV
jgi:dTDP-glucose 4,6-dehydratase